MSRYGEFIEKVYKINESSAKYASIFQRVNEEVISKVYDLGIRSVNPLFEFVSKLKRQMVDILPLSFATNLMPLLRPIFDAFSSEFENEVVSNLEPFRLSLFWRFKPLTDIIDKIVSGLREESRRILLNRRRLPTYSIQLKDYPISFEEAPIVEDHIGPISRFEHRLSPRTPKLTIRRGMEYIGYDTITKLTSKVDTKDEVPQEVPFDVPIISLAPDFVRVREKVVDVLEKGTAARLSSAKLSKAYIHRAYDWKRASSTTISQMSDIGKFYYSIPVIKRGLQLLSTSGVGTHITELPSVVPSPFMYIEEQPSEAPIVGHPPRIQHRLDYDALKLGSQIFMLKSSLSESVFSQRLLEIETMLKEVLRHLFRVYSLSPSISRLSSITGISKIDRDHFRGEFAWSVSGYPKISIPALAAITPRASKVYSELIKSLLLPPQLTDLDKSKYMLPLSEVGSYSRIITEEIAKSSVFRTQLHPVFKALHGILTRQDYRTAATRGFHPSIGFRMVEKLPVEEYYELGKRFDAVSESNHAIPLMLDGFKQLSFRTSSLFLQPSLVKMTEAISKQQPIKLDLSVLDTFYGVSKEVVDHEIEVQRALQLSVDGAISDMMVVEEKALERFPLDVPMTMPTLKLQEIASTISSIQPPAQREMPTRIMRDRLTTSGSSRSIEVTVDSLRDERDVRELERKLARILREEARRYGLI